MLWTYRVLGVLSALCFGLLLLFGLWQSVTVEHRLPGVSLAFGTAIYEALEQNDYPRALKEMRIAIAINVQARRPLYLELAAIAARQRDFETVIQALRSADQMSPLRELDLCNEMSVALLRRNDPFAHDLEESISYSERALALEPGFAPAECNLGAAYMMLGNRPLAEQHFRKALQLAPGLPPAVAGLQELQRDVSHEQSR